MAKLNDARRSLERAKASAERRLEAIEVERRELKASVRSLDAAMRVLEKKPKTPKAELNVDVQLVARVIDSKGPLTFEELLAELGRQISSSGTSLPNLRDTLQATLSKEAFELLDGHYRLRSEE